MEVIITRIPKLFLSVDAVQNRNNYQGILLSESSSTIWSVFYDEDEDHGCVCCNDVVTLHLTELEFPLDIKPGDLGAACRLSNSCNGLVCAVISMDSVVIWNPSLQDYKRIPISGRLVLSDDNGDDIFGIGYDSISDDYKIVRFPSILCESEHSPRNRIEVFSLKTNSWKTIQDSSGDFPYLVLQESRAITLKGRPHWKEEGHILYFDASQECLGEMAWPDLDSGFVVESLQQIRGCLGVHTSEMLTHNELWVMKEYGVNESWTRMIRIPKTHVPGPLDVFIPLQPFGCTKDGKVLLKLDHHGFFLYNPETSEYKKFDIPHKITCSFGDVPFVETPVSPNPANSLK